MGVKSEEMENDLGPWCQWESNDWAEEVIYHSFLFIWDNTFPLLLKMVQSRKEGFHCRNTGAKAE